MFQLTCRLAATDGDTATSQFALYKLIQSVGAFIGLSLKCQNSQFLLLTRLPKHPTHGTCVPGEFNKQRNQQFRVASKSSWLGVAVRGSRRVIFGVFFRWTLKGYLALVVFTGPDSITHYSTSFPAAGHAACAFAGQDSTTDHYCSLITHYLLLITHYSWCITLYSNLINYYSFT